MKKKENMIFKAIESLVDYGEKAGLINRSDAIYTRNRLLDVLRVDEYEEAQPESDMSLCEILKTLTDHAVEKGLCGDSTENRDIFDTRLMNCLAARPSEVERVFKQNYAVSPEKATDVFYRFCGDINYIHRDRIKKDRKWTLDSDYGTIDVTINLSKPEKDPRDIALAGKSSSQAYPKCQLCRENVGYAGRIGHPARANLRAIPIKLCEEDWFFQYSPYVYYNEHCIVFNKEHTPMKISEKTFSRLLEFVKLFPHYFIGSNADLPIVGGSILSHDHFQGGRYAFAMEKAEIEYKFKAAGFEDVDCGIVKWPLSVIRIRSKKAERLTELASLILEKWRSYTDEEAFVFAETDGIPHNTVTPIARRRGDDFELDLCLRNNITTKEHPLGVYHPHAKYHHIKKENIGLIEVMGLAVLPSRLNNELETLEAYIAEGKDISSDESTAKHAEWASLFKDELCGQPHSVVRARLEKEVGKVFLGVLEDAGVFKRDEKGKKAFLRFTETIKKP